MSFTSPLHDRRSPLRSIASRLAGQRSAKRDVFVDRNTSPTDFVLRDYRYVR